jgi:hypothetical protein
VAVTKYVPLSWSINVGVRYVSRTAAVGGVAAGVVCLAAGEVRLAVGEARESRTTLDLDNRAATTWCLETGDILFFFFLFCPRA